MKRTMKLASRSKRLGAGLIDMSVPFLSYFILTAVYGVSILGSNNDPYGYGNGFGYGYDFGYNYDLPKTGAASAGIAVLGFILLAYLIAELVLYARAQSIGKALLGLKVVSSSDGKPFGFWKMMLRECVVKQASGGTFLLGYIWILLDERNRGWHDKILDSYVVDLKETANMYMRASAAGDVQTDNSIKEDETDRI